MNLSDIRYTLRILSKRPGFVFASVVTLALAIGANTAIFSVVNAVLVRALPFQNPDRLVTVWQTDPKRGIDHFSVSIPYFQGWRDRTGALEQVAAFTPKGFDLVAPDGAEHVEGTLVSANFFSLLGVKPFLGRAFLPEEDNPTHSNVAVISHELWRRRFGGETRLDGKTLKTDTASYAIVGVMPAGFRFTGPSDIWVPLGKNAESLSLPAHLPAAVLAAITPLEVVARLKAGVSIDRARADLSAVTNRMQAAFGSPWQSRIVTLSDEVVGIRTRRILLVLLASVGLVLLIACANVVNLQLAHVTNRHREMATRLALGATKRVLISQLLAESAVISIAGGALGLLAAAWAMRALAAMVPPGILDVQSIGIDWRVLLFTACVSLAIVPIFGVIPALRIFHPNLADSLRDGSLGMSQDWHRRRLQNGFVVSQIAFASVLLIGALLTIKSLHRMSRIDLGFVSGETLTMRVNLPASRYGQPEKQIAFFDEARRRIEAAPGVQEAGIVSFLPLMGMTWQWSLSIEGDESANVTHPANYRVVDDEYFRAMRIPLRRGRSFSIADSPTAPQVAIVNQAMANQFWPNRNPVGQRIRMGDRTSGMPWIAVIGVVADVKEVDLTGIPKPVFYVPFSQHPQSSMALVIRSAQEASTLASAVRERIVAIDRNLPVQDIRTMDDALASSTAPSRFNMLLLTIFAAIATALALVGIHGLISYSIQRRTREMGIRLALGARREQIVRMLLGEAAALVAIGIVGGLLLAVGLTRFLANLLYEVKPFDPAVFAFVALLLSSVAILAAMLPARRTTGIDPAISLRYE